ncbi:MAG TPA: DUF448 domain-containing protein [Clostridiales bacterium]|nr:DUF448 domain-containing protein [Clostridiales bacterium]
MVKRKVPIRKCIGCNESKPKKELIRIVKDQEGNIKVDSTGKAAGRGAYICCNTLCLEKAQKGKRLQKAFEMNIADDLYERLGQEIKGKMIHE